MAEPLEKSSPEVPNKVVEIKKSPMQILRDRIESDRRRLYNLGKAESYKENIRLAKKYYRFTNRPSYEPWFTYIRVTEVPKTYLNSVIVTRFEVDLDGNLIYSRNSKRKVDLLGDKIDQAEYHKEFMKFKLKIREG